MESLYDYPEEEVSWNEFDLDEPMWIKVVNRLFLLTIFLLFIGTMAWFIKLRLGA